MSIQRALGIVLIYALFGATWIYFSDSIVTTVVPDGETLRWVNTLKGWAFIAVTGILLYALIVNALRRQERLHRDLLEADRSRRASADRLAGLLDNMSDGFVALDRDLRFLYLNSRAAAALQRDARDLVGTPVADAFPAVVGTSIEDACRRALREQRALAAEHCDEPSNRWVEGYFYPTPEGISILFHDVTERKLAEAKLRQAAMVFDTTRDGITITDAAANILAVNRAFTVITGYAEAEVLGQNPRLLKSERHDAAFYQGLWATLLSSGTWEGEIWNRRKNGEVYPQWLTISAVADRQGQPMHYVAVFTDIGPQRRSEAELERLAHYDPLTALPNRVMVQAHLERAVGRAGRHGTRAALLYVDLDRFKSINESLGHAVGDELLVAVSRRLRERLRQEDVVGRLGGDEFMVVVEPVERPEDAAVVARDLLETLDQPFQLAAGNEVFVGASIGISIFPDDGDTSLQLLRAADSATYRAKEDGRNRFCFYTGDMNAEAMTALATEFALRRAVERKEFLLHYQPKVDLRTGRITGAEALLRWQREGSGLIPPGLFIPLAEKNGLIDAIGEWVIDAACLQIRTWREQGLAPLPVSVNVSAVQLRSGRLDGVVAAALARHKVDPSLLELELTESTLMEHPDTAAELLGKLKKLGVRVSLDDFGTGFSSLAQLLLLPLDSVKIDRSFVSDVALETNAAVIATLIIGLAHRLRLRVVAEGIETEAQLGYLRQRNCDEMQGYFFSRPVAAEAFADQVRTGHSLPIPVPPPGLQRTLLLVDDEPSIASAIRRLLRPEGYQILVAGNARDALEFLACNPVQVILSDQRMPGMSGVEFLGQVRDMYPDTVRIVLSGYYDVEAIVRAVNVGAVYKYLTKPWDDDLLRQHIADAFRYYEEIVRPRSNSAGSPGGENNSSARSGGSG